jgi:hypothetical protein
MKSKNKIKALMILIQTKCLIVNGETLQINNLAINKTNFQLGEDKILIVTIKYII